MAGAHQSINQAQVKAFGSQNWQLKRLQCEHWIPAAQDNLAKFQSQVFFTHYFGNYFTLNNTKWKRSGW